MKPEAVFSLKNMIPIINTSHEKELGPAMRALIGFDGLEQPHLGPPHPPLCPWL